MGTLILTDNLATLGIAEELRTKHGAIDIFQSPGGTLENVPSIDVNTAVAYIAENYQLVISLHNKQIFPTELVRKVRCVNVHPGNNPWNRGWFPHVFSIINGMKAGVTIHEIDEYLDHGPIIVQREYKIRSWDTSKTAYASILSMERDLLEEYYTVIRDLEYMPYSPSGEGNLNMRKDFESLKLLDLEQYGRFGDFLNHLRSLTHEPYRNCYFVDENGTRVFVRIVLEPDDGR